MAKRHEEQTAQIQASAEARFAQVTAEVDQHIRSNNASVDGAQSDIREAEERHKLEVIALQRDSLSTVEDQRKHAARNV